MAEHKKITDPFFEIDYDKWNRSVKTIISDKSISEKEVAKRLRTMPIPYKPLKLLDLPDLLIVAENLHMTSIANKIRKGIAQRSDKHIGYLITITLADNNDFVLLRQFCDKFTKSKFYRESSSTALRYELTDKTKLVHVHIYVENPNRLQRAQLEKRLKTVNLDRYNLDLLPVNRNNGMEKYVNKCTNHEAYRAYCDSKNKDYDPTRVDDVIALYDEHAL